MTVNEQCQSIVTQTEEDRIPFPYEVIDFFIPHIAQAKEYSLLHSLTLVNKFWHAAVQPYLNQLNRPFIPWDYVKDGMSYLWRAYGHNHFPCMTLSKGMKRAIAEGDKYFDRLDGAFDDWPKHMTYPMDPDPFTQFDYLCTKYQTYAHYFSDLDHHMAWMMSFIYTAHKDGAKSVAEWHRSGGGTVYSERWEGLPYGLLPLGIKVLELSFGRDEIRWRFAIDGDYFIRRKNRETH